MSDMVVGAFFTQGGGTPATGLALADIDFYLTAQNKSTGADTVIWDGTQNPTEEIDNVGAYARIYALANLDTYVYYAYANYIGIVALDVDHVTGSAPCVDPWAFETRTLTSSALSTVAAVVGSVITQPWASYWNFTITGLGNITARASLYFTIKRKTTDVDASAVVQIEETAGLLVVNGAAPIAAGNATMTVTDAVVGNINITVAAVETNKLRLVDGLWYDYKMITVAGLAMPPLTINRFNISDVVTGAIA